MRVPLCRFLSKILHKTSSRSCQYTCINLYAKRSYHGDAVNKLSKNSHQSAAVVDLRSDTITKPTANMRRAMAEAEVGDDVFGEDPTVNALQDRVAKMLGMEAALYVPSGTMGNLIAVLEHCKQRGLEVLLGDKSHIYLFEQGGIATLGGVHPRPLINLPDGTFDLEDLESYVRPRDDPHQPWTQLVCVENTHNFSGGKVIPISFLQQLRRKADEFGIAVHMDGARVMNAAISLNLKLPDILSNVDSVNICLSKGVGAPVGSLIGGKTDFIAGCLRLRKVLGGGMRQAGVIAAAAMVALDDAPERLSRDHEHAKLIANALHNHGAGVVDVDIEGVHSNMVMVDIMKEGLTAQDLCNRLNQVTPKEVSESKMKTEVQVQVRPARLSNTRVRLYTHSNVSYDDIQNAIAKWKYVCAEYAS